MWWHDCEHLWMQKATVWKVQSITAQLKTALMINISWDSHRTWQHILLEWRCKKLEVTIHDITYDKTEENSNQQQKSLNSGRTHNALQQTSPQKSAVMTTTNQFDLACRLSLHVQDSNFMPLTEILTATQTCSAYMLVMINWGGNDAFILCIHGMPHILKNHTCNKEERQNKHANKQEKLHHHWSLLKVIMNK